MDAFVLALNRLDLPAISFNIEMILDTGYVAETPHIKEHMLKQGYVGMKCEEQSQGPGHCVPS